MASIPDQSTKPRGSAWVQYSFHSRALVADAPQKVVDPYYGQSDIANICERFIMQLFSCPSTPKSTGSCSPLPLAQFIAYTIHRAQVDSSVVFGALYFLNRLKVCVGTATMSLSGHRLWLPALLIAHKVLIDRTYSNKSWSAVSSGMFPIREVNQLEREFISRLDWQLHLDHVKLSKFEERVREDFGGPWPKLDRRPTIDPPLSTNTSFSMASQLNAVISTVTSSSARTVRPPPSAGPHRPSVHVNTRDLSHNASYHESPDTPEASSPASSASPATPDDYEDRAICNGSVVPVPFSRGFTPFPCGFTPYPGQLKQSTRHLGRSADVQVIWKSRAGEFVAHAIPPVW